MTGIFERILLPVADVEDARTSARAVRPYATGGVTAVHVVEKAGGAPDKASVEQREEQAAEMFEAVRAELGSDVATRIAYGTDIAETIFEVGDEIDATCIAFSPREGSRWVRLLTGDVALDLVTETDRPVLVLPDTDE